MMTVVGTNIGQYENQAKTYDDDDNDNTCKTNKNEGIQRYDLTKNKRNWEMYVPLNTTL